MTTDHCLFIQLQNIPGKAENQLCSSYVNEGDERLSYPRRAVYIVE